MAAPECSGEVRHTLSKVEGLGCMLAPSKFCPVWLEIYSLAGIFVARILVGQGFSYLACKFVGASRSCGALRSTFITAQGTLYVALQACFDAR